VTKTTVSPTRFTLPKLTYRVWKVWRRNFDVFMKTHSSEHDDAAGVRLNSDIETRWFGEPRYYEGAGLVVDLSHGFNVWKPA